MVRAQTQDTATAQEPGAPKTPAADRPGAPHPIGTDTQIRIARPSRNLATAMHFYVEGLGLEVLWHTTRRAPGKHDLLMVGPRGGVWHFELTHDPEQPLEPPRPSTISSSSTWGSPLARIWCAACWPPAALAWPPTIRTGTSTA